MEHNNMPANSVPPDLRFLLRHPAHFIALGFGSGLSRLAPGTVGTLVAIPLFLLLMQLPEWQHYVLIALAFVLGVWACARTGQALGVADHGGMVWDEIVAFLLVLEFTPHQAWWWLIAFTLFRLFDVWKPFPIRQCDARLKGGFGVMFDDMLAAVYSILSLMGLQWLTLNF
ncbi:phosphatidylglycerophosphatase A [Pseudomethylobacillus aquaticus]|uniref:Phosphatidylglycerophosphatase A n=2 Tax=Pseudomethylobacillus aquaticus TaxID=2676064 RepID=A0A3N0UY05_9PROT|nr:phosphatidylglycerophosphatase A [Pseudomethylobacillus aquaticus]